MDMAHMVFSLCLKKQYIAIVNMLVKLTTENNLKINENNISSDKKKNH